MQVFRVYGTRDGAAAEKNIGIFSEFLEVENFVAVTSNQEMISRFTVNNITSNSSFFTDNGLETIQRHYRERFEDDIEWSMIAGNYYPIISSALVRDDVNQLTIMTRQSVGGSSQYNGFAGSHVTTKRTRFSLEFE